MIFLLFLEMLLLKIESWKMTSDFSKNFSDFGGSTRVPPPSAGAYRNMGSKMNEELKLG